VLDYLGDAAHLDIDDEEALLREPRDAREVQLR